MSLMGVPQADTSASAAKTVGSLIGWTIVFEIKVGAPHTKTAAVQLTCRQISSVLDPVGSFADGFSGFQGSRFAYLVPIRGLPVIRTTGKLAGPDRENHPMSLLNILQYPDTQLRTTAEPVNNVDGRIATLVDSMFDTMYEAPGIGLAATQVNVHERVVVIDVSENNDQPLTLINPELITAEGEAEMEEGCLSIPGIYEKVTRPAQIRVGAIDREGNPYELDAEGLLAVCIQHEIDHLNGKLFVDYLSSLKRNRIRKKLIKQQRQDD